MPSNCASVQAALWTAAILISATSYAQTYPNASLSTPTLKPLVEKFLFFSDMGLYERPEFAAMLEKSHASSPQFESAELQKLLAPDCKLETSGMGGTETLTRDEYVRQLPKDRFMWGGKTTILEGPVFSTRGPAATVSLVQYFDEYRRPKVSDTTLTIELRRKHPLITHVRQAWREPTDAETRKARRLANREPYNPLLGLGSRYLGGGCFSGVSPSFSPDGKSVVFASVRNESSEIYCVGRSGSNETRLTSTTCWEISPSFTPDGTHIVFMSDQDNPHGEPWIMDTDGSDAHRLFPEIDDCSVPSYSPDGKMMVFTAGRVPKVVIIVAKADGSNPRAVSPPGSFDPVFSTLGTSICFSRKFDEETTSGSRESTELFSVNVDGTRLERLTSDGMSKSCVGWPTSPDRILYTVYVGNRAVWSVTPHGDTPELLVAPKNNGAFDVQMSPDQSRIIYISDEVKPYEYELFSCTLRNAPQTQQLTHAGQDVGDCCFSPDGKEIVFVQQTPEAPRCGTGEISIIPVTGGEISQIAKAY